MDLLACKHQHKGFVSSLRSSKETNRVMICEECGRVFVSGTKEGVHFDVSFHIDDEAQLEAIGKWTHWINDTDH